MDRIFKVSELRTMLSESSSEFKAKLGDGVESANKSTNEKAYSDSKKRTEDFNGKAEKNSIESEAKKIEVPQDGNKTTLDYNPETVTDDYKKRVQAQAEGYTSVAEKENGIEKSGDFEKNKEIYQAIKKKGQEIHQDVADLKATGLQARMLPKDTFEKEEMYENKIKTAYFKKTEFLSESIMLSKIPDEFKVEGNTFKMKDKTGSEYLIEWKNNSGKILDHKNKQGLDESVARMKELMGYKTSDTKTSMSSRLNENKDTLDRTLDLMRKITK